jgi:hypothetical protein
VLADLLAFYPALDFSNTGTFNLSGFFWGLSASAQSDQHLYQQHPTD